jgi:phosphomevalonate kinase
VALLFSAAYGAKMSNKIPVLVVTFAIASVLIGVLLHLHERQALDELRKQFVASEVQPIATLLQENQSILKELQTEPFSELNSGILESYLAKIRRDGVAKHADMKQRLDQLAENNTAVVTLIKAYAPHAKTAVFTKEADKFRNYASAWRDRWNSVMELFMAGGNYAVAGVPFPAGFPAAVDAEIAAAK